MLMHSDAIRRIASECQT